MTLSWPLLATRVVSLAGHQACEGLSPCGLWPGQGWAGAQFMWETVGTLSLVSLHGSCGAEDLER